MDTVIEGICMNFFFEASQGGLAFNGFNGHRSQDCVRAHGDDG